MSRVSNDVQCVHDSTQYRIRRMIRHVTRIVGTLLGATTLMSTDAPAQPIRIAYREAADAFEILDHVSNRWPGFTEPAYRV